MKFLPKSLTYQFLVFFLFAHASAFALEPGEQAVEKKVEPTVVKETPAEKASTPEDENADSEADPNEHEVEVGEEEGMPEKTPNADIADPAEPANADPKTEGSKKTDPKVEEAPKKTVMQVFGWKEWIWAVNPEHLFRAKLDTGARTCSIHATNVETYESDGEKWVKFTISDPRDADGPRLRHKAPVLRVSKIKNDSGGIDERIVVPLTFQVGETKLEAEFNLNDRSDMICPILLGRNVLKNIGVVDASRIDVVGKPKMKKTALPKKEPTK